jgi:thiol-disulfide isomerase/thioredoxin
MPAPDETAGPPTGRTGGGAGALGAGEPSSTDTPAPSEASEDDLAAINKLLGEMREAYQKVPTLTDTLVARYVMQGNVPEPQRFQIKLGKGETFSFFDPQLNLWCMDGTLYVTAPSRPETYIKRPLGSDLFSTLQVLAEGGQYQGMPAVFYALRYDLPQDVLIRTLSLGLTGRVRLSAYRQITAEDGTPLEQITLFSGDGGATINVNQKTKLLHSARAEYTPQGAPAGFTIMQEFEFNPEIHEELPEPVALPFDPADRTRVPTVRGLYGLAPREPHTPELKIAKGEMAPDFVLVTLEGERRSLSDTRGKVVVLEFWSTWCIPSFQTLPKLQQFADWAGASGLPIEVVPINTMQREPTEGKKWEAAYERWEKLEMTLKSLIDTEDVVPKAFGFGTLPTTIVLDRQGRLFWAQAGVDENQAQTLREIVQRALEQSS